MGANVGQNYEQTKALDGFPYNAVGETWVLNDIKGKYFVLKNGGVGLGVDKSELKEYFKLVSDQSYDSYDGVEEMEDEKYEEYDEIDEEIYEEDDNKQIGKFNSFLRRIGLRK